MLKNSWLLKKNNNKIYIKKMRKVKNKKKKRLKQEF